MGMSRADLGVGPGGSGSPFCVLLNISALHVQYGIEAFAKFKRPECTKTYLRELTSISKIFAEEHEPKTP